MDLPIERGDCEPAGTGCSSTEVVALLKARQERLALHGCPAAVIPYLASRILLQVARPLLLVAPNDEEAQRLFQAIPFFHTAPARAASPLERPLWLLPSRTAHKAQSVGKMEVTARRLETLYALRAHSSPAIVVTSALALLERLPPREAFMGAVDYRVVGDDIDPDGYSRLLGERGYYRVSLVEAHGDMSRRGGVLDLYPPLYEWPVRLEFFGEQVESMRLFHPGNQRSLRSLEDVVVLPASEIILDQAARERAQQALYHDVQRERLTPAAGNVWLEKLHEGHQLTAFEALLPVFYETTECLADYLDAGTLVVFTDPSRTFREMEERTFQFAREWEARRTPHEWSRPPSDLFLSPEEVREQLNAFQQVWVNPWVEERAGGSFFSVSADLAASGQEALIQAVKAPQSRERLLEPLVSQFRRWRQEGLGAFLVCRQKEQAERLVKILEDYRLGVRTSRRPFSRQSFDATTVHVLLGPLEKGFVWPAERLAVVAEEELFGGRRSRHRGKKSVAGVFLNSFQDLHPDDLVVHVDHGIGVYKGLIHLNVQEIENDFLLLEYMAGDRLYVPVDKFQKVQKYLGIEGQAPQVDRLGGKSWAAVKARARESAQRVAEELLRLYALRQVREGMRFSPPDSLYREFEATFAYDETPDQQRAIEEVLEDMTSARPMDRLICGDVGYGKTEVALRAAFKAAMDGKQVAMLVPTTVLAEQHFQTFRERFAGFPLAVESLSRFKTPSQQRKVVEGLTRGTIDVVVGTHRLLQPDVTFRELGLLIIDEEHRFGVKDKERLKQLRVSVDVLTLTATPIPRTLHMSLAGIRDLSTMETPPQDRRAIETFVCKYDELTIQEAIYRELERGGQVFFVHNHVQSIYAMANLLGRLVPQGRIGVAHGQMKERELEGVMLDFVQNKLDVLVCTSIIESGLDIPAANTIIVNRADKFGLAQIYQLRGRVGRAAEQAFAYLLIPGEFLITRDAQRRLRALMDFSELGAGFKIALNDLQIRGGGNILGAAQSGHIAAVGYELYLELLERTVREIKGEKVEEPIDPEINVPLSAFLPENYVTDADQRLLAYRRLAGAVDAREVEEQGQEWRDRFGPLPAAAKNLVLLARIRQLLMQLRVMRLDGEADGFTLRFAADTPIRYEALEEFARDQARVTMLGNTGKLFVEIGGSETARRLARLKIILQELRDRVTGKIV